MATSDERREVAERLRELPSYADADGCCTEWDVLFALGLKQSDTIGFVRADDALRIADLIDPICRDIGDIHVFVCSKCRCELDVDDREGEPTMWKGGVPSVPRYCPNCRSRVVNIDETREDGYRLHMRLLRGQD